MKLSVATGLAFFISGSCCGDILTVDDDGKADFDNIQDAIDAASVR